MSANSSIKKIGVFTSGGDAPGMNAAIRAVVRAAEFYKIKPIGIYRGYEGLMDGDFIELDARSVSNIINRGGTILKSARSQRFRTAEGRKQAFDHVKQAGIDALVAIGGDGTFTGASVFLEEHNVPTIGIPGTIDNDLSGTDFTIGYDTACNTVIHAVDAIRDTASSHNRMFFIEVMGRDSGFIAMRSGLAAGVEFILVPEREMTIEDLVKKLECSKKKSSGLVIVAEGLKMGSAIEIAAKVKERFSHYDTKVTVLGHIQRGGSPSCLDREIASRMGVAAIEGLLQGKKNVMVGIINGGIVYNSFEEVVNNPQPINFDLLRINEILSV
jgi:6-phosphofructokinase 1